MLGGETGVLAPAHTFYFYITLHNYLFQQLRNSLEEFGNFNDSDSSDVWDCQLYTQERERRTVAWEESIQTFER
jgi:hypothetical protein